MSKFITKTIVDAQSMASDITSSVINLQYNYGFALQCSFSTAGGTGSVIVQGSNDQTNWSQIDSLALSGNTVLSSNKDAIYWPYIRVFKASGGTGNMTVTITVKGA
jgi:hypothetical protein